MFFDGAGASERGRDDVRASERRLRQKTGVHPAYCSSVGLNVWAWFRESCCDYDDADEADDDDEIVEKGGFVPPKACTPIVSPKPFPGAEMALAKYLAPG